MRVRETPDLGQTARPGDTTRRAGVDGLRARGIDPDELATRLIAAALAELATDYRHSASGRHVLAGGWRENFDLCVTRLHELGASMPSVPEPFPAATGGLLEGLLEAERDGIRRWWELCDLCAGRDYRTLELAQRVLSSKIHNEAVLIDALSAG
jgi:ferritin-like protein